MRILSSRSNGESGSSRTSLALKVLLSIYSTILEKRLNEKREMAFVSAPGWVIGYGKVVAVYAIAEKQCVGVRWHLV